MTYTYVGPTPRFLASGRPVTFGTELQESDVELADDATRAHLVPSSSKSSTPAPAAPAPAAPPAEAPAPEVATTGNPS